MTRNLLVCLSLLFVGLAASPARADEAPDPPKIRQPPPPPPPEPAKVDVPAKVDAPAPAKVDAPAPIKTDAPAKTETTTKKTESGGMCRVDATAGAWPLLALVGLGVRRRRRLAYENACR